jgi:hypothetical protein
MAMVTPTTGGFEFSNEQNGILSGLAGAMRGLAILMILLGALSLLGGVLTRGGLVGPAQGLFLIVVGAFTLTAARSFRQIVTTSGTDVTHLMDPSAPCAGSTRSSLSRWLWRSSSGLWPPC